MKKMYNEKNTTAVAIIGNGPEADILYMLLSKNGYDVTQYCSIRKIQTERPFYPNDLTTGIMGKFLTDCSFSIDSRKKLKWVSLVSNSFVFKIPANFDKFEKWVYVCFPKIKKETSEFFSTVRQIGNEWKQYILSGFSDVGCMKISAKLYLLTLEDAFIKYGIEDTRLQLIFQMLLPKKEVMFSVFCGYLYTQFFDVCALSHDVFEEIHQHEKIVFVPELKKICICETINKNSTVSYNVVIDFRPSENLSYPNEKGGVVTGYFMTDDDCGLQKETEYLVQLPSFDFLRIWNKGILSMDAPDNFWNFELILQDYQKPYTEVQLKECILNFIAAENLSEIHISGIKELDANLDTIHANGYEWAFDKIHTLNDPANLVKKHHRNILNSCHWGFAWFSAGYHALNIVTNQMQYDRQKYFLRW